MKALAALDVDPQRVRWRDAAPIAVRPTGPGRVHLVQAAGGPLGGDELGLDVTVAAGAEIEVCSAAATLAQPGPHGDAAYWSVRADVAGALRWWPEPTVVCADADYRAHVTVDLTTDARLTLARTAGAGQDARTRRRIAGG